MKKKTQQKNTTNSPSSAGLSHCHSNKNLQDEVTPLLVGKSHLKITKNYRLTLKSVVKLYIVIIDYQINMN